MKLAIKLLLSITLLVNVSGYAQVLTDGSVGKVQPLSGQMIISQDLGRLVGNNLFHSFKIFNINTGESATFTGANSIKNVISRVTGGQVSTINGLLKSEIGTANFYFINPAGVTFGEHAKVDVPAAFHVSTAEGLRFADGSEFNATNLTASTLSIAEPVSFGFLGNNAGNIEIQNAHLQFKNQATVSLSANNIMLNAGQLVSKAGTVQLYATGNAAADIKLNGLSNDRLSGNVDIIGTGVNNQSGIDVSGDQVGKVVIRSGSVNLSNAYLFADNLAASDASAEKGIDIIANDMTVNNSYVTADALKSGNSANINIDLTGQLKVSGDTTASIIRSAAWDKGNSGNVNIKAADVNISGAESNTTGDISGGEDKLSPIVGILSDAEETSTNSHAGIIKITTDNLMLSNNGVIRSITFGIGKAGAIDVSVAKNLTIQKGGAISSSTFGEGKAGHVSVSANNLLIDRTAEHFISTDGKLDINSIIDSSQTGNSLTGIFSASFAQQPGKANDAGTVKVTAHDTLYLSNGGVISTTSLSDAGSAGNVTVNAGNLLIDGSGGGTSSVKIKEITKNSDGSFSSNLKTIGLSQPISPGISSDIFFSNGQAGTVNVTANILNMTNGGVISSDTSAISDAGKITVKADRLTMLNKSLISSSTFASGKAGNISVQAANVSLDNATISAQALETSSGQTGNVEVSATKSLQLTGQAKISIQNDATVTDPSQIETGSIKIFAPQIDLKNSAITAASTGNVDASDIHSDFSHLLTMDSSLITTAATDGNGGSITIHGGEVIKLQNSGFLTSVTGASGNGGNIDVTADTVVMNTGGIQANAVTGTGGDINLNLKALIPSYDSLIKGGSQVIWQANKTGLNVIQAASEHGVSGAINLTSPNFNISGAISGLTANALDLPNINRSPCQGSTLKSSLARSSKGGVPLTEFQAVFIPPAVIPASQMVAPEIENTTSALDINHQPCAAL